MDFSTSNPARPAQVAALPAESAANLRIRAVHRAIGELRRGVPVLLGDGVGPALVVLAAETAGAQGLRELSAVAIEAPVLLLTSGRAAALLEPATTAAPVAAFAIPGLLTNPELLHGLADPTAEQLLKMPPLPSDPPPLAAAALALIRLARLLPAAVVAHVSGVAGTDMSGLLGVASADVEAYPLGMATALRRVADVAVPLAGAASSRVVMFRGPDAGIEHLAIVIGQPEDVAAPLVRIHSECFTGDLLGSLRCDCGAQLQGAIRRIDAEGAGVVLYLAQEGRGIGLANKLRAYALQDRGMDTVDANHALGWGADERNFLVAATMLEELGIGRIRLLTNNPMKVAALEACGIVIERRESHAFPANGTNDRYLATKAARLGHLLG